MPEYLCYFAQIHENFRLAELQALSDLFSAELDYTHEDYSETSPFLKIRLKSVEVARKILERAILVKAFIDLWSEASDYKTLLERVRCLPDERMTPMKSDKVSFKFCVEGFGKSLSLERQVEIIEYFGFLPFEGPIKLKNPNHVFYVFEEHTIGSQNPKEEPRYIYFGELVGKAHRHHMDAYDLKKRDYIGTTSMDAELSLVMANMAHARSGSLVMDPFLGTGGLLVAAAHFGAWTMGADIDPRVIKGKNGKNPLTNFRQYGLDLKSPDILICDITKSPWIDSPLFDAILTDPPYGLRAGARILGSRKDIVKPIPEHLKHITPWKPHEIQDVIADLLNFAARHLVMHGKLVYWLPMTSDEDLKECLKEHKCFSTISKSLQTFNKWKRWLITSKKIAHPDKGNDELDTLHVDLAIRQDFSKRIRGKESPESVKKDLNILAT